VFTDRPLRRLYRISFLCGLGIFGFYRCVLIYMPTNGDAGGSLDPRLLLFLLAALLLASPAAQPRAE
jgi:hypothetical protein